MNNAEQSENIGYCENCGLLDHHLVRGLCEGCNKKTDDGNEYPEDVAVGAEADVRHVNAAR